MRYAVWETSTARIQSWSCSPRSGRLCRRCIAARSSSTASGADSRRTVLEMTSSLDTLKQRSISALSWLCKACIWMRAQPITACRRRASLHEYVQTVQTVHAVAMVHWAMSAPD